MNTLAPSPELSPSESLAVRVVVVGLVGFGTFGFVTGAPSTFGYLLAVVAVGLAIRGFRTAPIDGPLAFALAIAAIVHLAGGLVPVGHDVLYNASAGPWIEPLHTHVVQYDHFAHTFASFVGTLTVWSLLVPPAASDDERRSLIGLCLLAGIGIGGVNETIEFLTTIAHRSAHVGGYSNTGWDLVANVVGATLAIITIRRAHRRLPVAA